MSWRHGTRLPQRATITRREQVDSQHHEPVYDRVVVDEDVPCRFDRESTTFIREDSGERVQRPATAAFEPGTDIREADHIEIDDVDTTFEVRGVTEETDHRRGRTAHIQAELERAD